MTKVVTWLVAFSVAGQADRLVATGGHGVHQPQPALAHPEDRDGVAARVDHVQPAMVLGEYHAARVAQSGAGAAAAGGDAAYLDQALIGAVGKHQNLVAFGGVRHREDPPVVKGAGPGRQGEAAYGREQ
jgi:hypothetical protein